MKLKHAPLIKTHSRKDIVTTNALLVDSNSQLSSDEKKEMVEVGESF